MSWECERMEGRIVDYVLGELDRSETEVVEEHVKSCPRCSEASGEIRRVLSAVSEQEVVEPSRAVWDSIHEAVRGKVLGGERRFSGVGALARSFVRRPLVAGATAMAAIAVVVLLVVAPWKGAEERFPGPRPSIKVGGTILREFGDYLGECEALMGTLSGRGAREVLRTYDWKTWVAQAMALKEREGLEGFVPLLEDVEALYWEIEACEGEFREEQIDWIRQVISEKRLRERIREAIRWRR